MEFSSSLFLVVGLILLVGLLCGLLGVVLLRYGELQRKQKYAEKEKKTTESLDKFDLFDPGERIVYRYFNGVETVAVDPVVIFKKLMQYLPDISHHMKVANSQHSDAHKAQGWLLEKIDALFDVKPLGPDGKGLTELERMWLLDHFLIYNESVKKNWSPPQTLQEEISRHSSPSSEGNQPIRSGTDFGSFATASKTEPPMPSSPPSSSPSE